MATITKPSRKPPKTTSFHRLRCFSVIGGFLDDQVFDFTDGLNCLIGGRGTGISEARPFPKKFSRCIDKCTGLIINDASVAGDPSFRLMVPLFALGAACGPQYWPISFEQFF